MEVPSPIWRQIDDVQNPDCATPMPACDQLGGDFSEGFLSEWDYNSAYSQKTMRLCWVLENTKNLKKKLFWTHWHLKCPKPPVTGPRSFYRLWRHPSLGQEMSFITNSRRRKKSFKKCPNERDLVSWDRVTLRFCQIWLAKLKENLVFLPLATFC